MLPQGTSSRNLHRILPLLRPEAGAAVDKGGYVSRRQKAGLPMTRVVAGWCVFFNQGCALHRLGSAEGGDTTVGSRSA